MRATAVIMAGMALNLGVCVLSDAQAQAPPRPPAPDLTATNVPARITHFDAYRLDLRISRNGTPIYQPSTVLIAGQASRLDSQARLPSGLLRLNQRVTAFPGSQGQKVLVELELYGVSGARTQRVVAPTLGLSLGRAQSYEIRTDQGLMRVQAIAYGLLCTSPGVVCPQEHAPDEVIEAPSGQPLDMGV